MVSELAEPGLEADPAGRIWERWRRSTLRAALQLVLQPRSLPSLRKILARGIECLLIIHVVSQDQEFKQADLAQQLPNAGHLVGVVAGTRYADLKAILRQ